MSTTPCSPQPPLPSCWTTRLERDDFSDGWVQAPSTLDLTEPATGAVLGVAGAGDAEAIARATPSAAAAQPAWAATPITERARSSAARRAELERHRAEIVR